MIFCLLTVIIWFRLNWFCYYYVYSPFTFKCDFGVRAMLFSLKFYFSFFYMAHKSQINLDALVTYSEALSSFYYPIMAIVNILKVVDCNHALLTSLLSIDILIYFQILYFPYREKRLSVSYNYTLMIRSNMQLWTAALTCIGVKGKKWCCVVQL